MQFRGNRVSEFSRWRETARNDMEGEERDREGARREARMAERRRGNASGLGEIIAREERREEECRRDSRKEEKEEKRERATNAWFGIAGPRRLSSSSLVVGIREIRIRPHGEENARMNLRSSLDGEREGERREERKRKTRGRRAGRELNICKLNVPRLYLARETVTRYPFASTRE